MIVKIVNKMKAGDPISYLGTKIEQLQTKVQLKL